MHTDKTMRAILLLLSVSVAYAQQGTLAGAARMHLPLTFEANRGQADARYRYLSNVHGQPVYFGDNEVVVPVGKADHGQPTTVRMSLVGAARAPKAELLEPTGGLSNYFIGNDPAQWHSKIPQYRKLKYKGVYPGIDLVYYGKQGKLEYDFNVQPGADPSQIELRHAGMENAAIDADGDLVFSVPGGGKLRQLRPLAYQMKDGKRSAVAVDFRLAGRGHVRLDVGKYDRKIPLIVDPVFAYLEYIDGYNTWQMVIDSSGYLYLATVNYPEISYGATSYTIFVQKLQPANCNTDPANCNAEPTVAYSTSVGGFATLGSISVDGSGRLFLAGSAYCGLLTMYAFQFYTASDVLYSGASCSTTEEYGTNAFVARLDSQGMIDRSSYLGGSGTDSSNLISVASDGSGTFYGSTSSSNFPYTNTNAQSAYCPSSQDNYCSYAASFDATFTSDQLDVEYDYSRYAATRDVNNGLYVAEYNYLFGPLYQFYIDTAANTYSNNVYITAMTTDASLNLYVTGYVSDNEVPAVNAFQGSNAGGTDAFVAELNSSGELVYATYLGGSGSDYGEGIAVDSFGNIFVSGTTYSTNFPGSNGQTTNVSGGPNTFVAELIPSAANQLAFTTFLVNSTGANIVANSNDDLFFGGLASGTIPVSASTTVYNTYSSPAEYLAELATVDLSFAEGTSAFGPPCCVYHPGVEKARVKGAAAPRDTNGGDGAADLGGTVLWQPVLSNLAVSTAAENPTVVPIGTVPNGLSLTLCTFTYNSTSGSCPNLTITPGQLPPLTGPTTVSGSAPGISLSINGTVNDCYTYPSNPNCAPPGSVVTVTLFGNSDNPDKNDGKNVTSLSYRIKNAVNFATTPVAGLSVSATPDYPDYTPTPFLSPDEVDPQASSGFSFCAETPQPGPTGTQYVFSKWNTGATTNCLSGVTAPIVSGPPYSTTYTATFDTQYQLTVNVSPSGTGSIKANPGGTLTNGEPVWYGSGTSVKLTAVPAAGYMFSSWSEDIGGSLNPSSLTMGAPHMVIANFVPLPPELSVASTHVGQFTQGQTNAKYTLTVSNASGALATSGTVTVTDTVPAGMTIESMSGTSGWTCGSNTCTRSNSLIGGASYPTITVTVSVSANATSPETNQVSVSGGGSASYQAMDSTVIAAGVASPVSVSPASGTSATQAFTFTFEDPNGYADLALVDVLMNNFLDGQQACYVAFAPAGASSGTLYLVDDAGVAGGPFAGSFVLGTAGASASNSQCTITSNGSSVSGSGNTLTLTLAVTFTKSFAGNKVIYVSQSQSSGNSGWQALATWNAPGSAPVGPGVGGVAPGRSTTMGQTYTFTFTDSNGHRDLAVVNVLNNNFLDGIAACYVAFAPTSATSGYLYLVDDAGDGGYAAGSPIALPSSSTLQNSQCTINGAGSSVSATGNTLTLNLAITFSSSFAGNRVFYLAARNNSTGNSGWQAVGSVTVP